MRWVIGIMRERFGEAACRAGIQHRHVSEERLMPFLWCVYPIAQSQINVPRSGTSASRYFLKYRYAAHFFVVERSVNPHQSRLEALIDTGLC